MDTVVGGIEYWQANPDFVNVTNIGDGGLGGEDKEKESTNRTHMYVIVGVIIAITLILLVANVVFCCCSRYQEYWRDLNTEHRVVYHNPVPEYRVAVHCGQGAIIQQHQQQQMMMQSTNT